MALTEEEAGVVTHMGADLLQGFLYGRPAAQPVLEL
jgi:EAL domain-containing protein (putative c-di-GMP-specific phosphodiesterase class I)